MECEVGNLWVDDHQLMDKVVDECIVLQSQSNSGNNHCRLAIRPKGADTSDLTPAHKQGATAMD